MKKEKVHPILRLLFILFILYVMIYILNISGYYNNKISQNVIATQKDIEKFEKDVAEGKKIKINNKVEKKKYDNFMTRMAVHLSSKLAVVFNNNSEEFLKLLKKLFS